MRIAVLLRCAAMMHGGGETRHLAWVRELRALGDEVTVITGRPLVAAAKYTIPGECVVLRTPYVRDFVYRWQQTRGFGRLTSQMLHADEEWFCRAAWRWIAAAPAPFDIVHAHALFQAARIGRGLRPTVINLPGLPNQRYFEDLRLADALVADGWAARHLPAALQHPVTNVPKGVDTELFRPEGPGVRSIHGLERARVVLVASRLVPIKNVALGIEAFARVAAAVPDAVLVVAGDGPLLPALKKQARDRGVADRTRFLGAVPHGAIAQWYRSADLLLSSSDFDNSPNVVLEAMASGLPVVVTDAGGLRDYVAEDSNGAIVPVGDVDALAAALRRYLENPDLARQIGVRNRADAVSRFSWAQSARTLRGVYESVLHNGRREPAAYKASA